MSDTLLPCPFCGAEARVSPMGSRAPGHFSVLCMNDECGIGPHAHHLGEQEAHEAWNTRACVGDILNEAARCDEYGNISDARLADLLNRPQLDAGDDAAVYVALLELARQRATDGKAPAPPASAERVSASEPPPANTRGEREKVIEAAMAALEEAEAILGGEYGDHYAVLCERMMALRSALAEDGPPTKEGFGTGSQPAAAPPHLRLHQRA